MRQPCYQPPALGTAAWPHSRERILGGLRPGNETLPPLPPAANFHNSPTLRGSHRSPLSSLLLVSTCCTLQQADKAIAHFKKLKNSLRSNVNYFSFFFFESYLCFFLLDQELESPNGFPRLSVPACIQHLCVCVCMHVHVPHFSVYHFSMWLKEIKMVRGKIPYLFCI